MKRAAEFVLLAGALVIAGNTAVRRAQAAPLKAPSIKPAKETSQHPGKIRVRHGLKSKFLAKKSSRRRHQSKQKAPTADRIREIQAGLTRAGFYQDEPTGSWDSATVEAMKRFQQAQGLNPSGKIDALTLQKLGLGSDVAGVGAPRPPLPGAGATATPNLPQH